MEGIVNLPFLPPVLSMKSYEASVRLMSKLRYIHTYAHYFCLISLQYGDSQLDYLISSITKFAHQVEVLENISTCTYKFVLLVLVHMYAFCLLFLLLKICTTIRLHLKV